MPEQAVLGALLACASAPALQNARAMSLPRSDPDASDDFESRLRPLWVRAQEGDEAAYRAALQRMAVRLRAYLRRRLPPALLERLTPELSTLGQLAGHVGYAAAGHHGGALLHRLAVVGQHLPAVLLADQGAVVGGRVIGPAKLHRLRPGLEGLHEALEDGPLHIHPLGAQAHLPGIEEGGAEDAVHRRVKVGVGKHDAGVLAAQLEVDALQRVGALFHDHAAGAAFTDEGDGLDGGMFGQRLAGFLADAVHGVEHAVGKARLFGELRQQVGVVVEYAGEVHHLGQVFFIGQDIGCFLPDRADKPDHIFSQLLFQIAISYTGIVEIG